MYKTIFKNFMEYHALTKTLTKYQKTALFKSLPLQEQELLFASFKGEGWQDLFTINEIDSKIDIIKKEFGIDLIYLRIEVISGNIQKVRRSFWNYVKGLIGDEYDRHHTRHVFGGIKVIDHNKDYVILVPSKRSNNGEEAGEI
jgi:hypothetical protein